ncbi:MAG: tRNA uridine-5-carboxymethylaminomethyl(34) synthesis GTPase MnmE [Treponema sp.]|jgi:tRNA modification GTPase|nr:tRNA uridine-5-carboxymethylaminomethyl(34) synthesis GTPase MnmE [Treponema sp.]
MTRARYGDDSPIAAFATVTGKSALTLIRCSGKGAADIVASVFSSDKLKRAPGNTVLHGWIISAGKQPHDLIDEVLVSVFRAPKSYTGEDGVDISCHGGPASGRAVMETLKAAGFRDALPGEFTFRAFMNGKVELTRSESVMELVSAMTEESRRRAVMRLSGSLEKEIGEIKKLLVEVLSSAEIFLDYSEDEIEADADEIAGKLPREDAAREALARLQKLSVSWKYERVYKEGLTLVIAGRPNAGKSSLFNMLLKEDRSIVTPVPGTTRDWIEAWISIEGIPVRLVDTAGLRESGDPVEKAGVERSLQLLDEAELVLYLIDGEEGVSGEDLDFITGKKFSKPPLVLWNKSDLVPMPQLQLPSGAERLSISAKTGEGLLELDAAIIKAFKENHFADPESGLYKAALGTARQKKHVDAACAALEEALSLAERGEPLDLISPLLRETVNALGEITGEVSTADILEEMFSQFCVGK